MGVDQNKALVRQALDLIWNKGDLSTAATLFSSDWVYHDPNYPKVSTFQDYRRLVADYRRAFPDIELVVEGQVAEGDMVVTRWGIHGTQKRSFLGFMPTERHVMATGVSIDIVQRTHITESRVNWDILGIYQQIGAVPNFPQPGAITTESDTIDVTVANP